MINAEYLKTLGDAEFLYVWLQAVTKSNKRELDLIDEEIERRKKASGKASMGEAEFNRIKEGWNQ